MRRGVSLLLAAISLAAACGSPVPSHAPTSTLPSAQPAATRFPALPAELGRVPGPGDPGAEVRPRTPQGEMEVDVARNFTLGHCGLMSPVDIDGSLWEPVGAHDGAGGRLTEAQVGDLINATPTVVVLAGPDEMLMRTEHGAVVLLRRHDGPRRYPMCD